MIILWLSLWAVSSSERCEGLQKFYEGQHDAYETTKWQSANNTACKMISTQEQNQHNSYVRNKQIICTLFCEVRLTNSTLLIAQNMHAATLGHCVFQGSLHITKMCVRVCVSYTRLLLCKQLLGKTAFTKKRNVYLHTCALFQALNKHCLPFKRHVFDYFWQAWSYTKSQIMILL